jgi:GT2 family glycosyltransferase
MSGDWPAAIAIVIVNWNGWRDSIGCIESCLALDRPTRIVLCDNASADGSAVNIAAAERGEDGGGAELLIVSTGANLGFAGGNNVGLRWAMARDFAYAWLLNNDTVVPSDSLSQLVGCMAADPKIGLCGSIMLEYSRPERLQGYAAAVDLSTFRGRHLGAGRPLAEVDQAMRDDPARAREALYPIGASILVSSAFLATVGLMEEGYFLYYEEADWVLRGRPTFTVAIARDSYVYHKVGASAGSTPQGTSARSVGFLYRSRLRLVRRLAPSQTPRVIVGILVEAARALARGRRGRVIGAMNALTGRVKVPNASKEKKR